MSCYMCCKRDCTMNCCLNFGGVCKYNDEGFEKESEPIECDPSECGCTEPEEGGTWE